MPRPSPTDPLLAYSIHGPFMDVYDEIDTHQNRLPHWQQGEVWVFVTWRLHDSLPKWKLDQWREERQIWLKFHPLPWDPETEIEYARQFPNRIDNWLDHGEGSCLLKRPEAASIVADCLRHFDHIRYDLASFVVMPNHVHVLFRPLENHSLSEIIKAWKGFSTKQINRRLDRNGSLWMPDYWDRLIRSPQHFLSCSKYIRLNPIKANLKGGQFVLFERPTPSPGDEDVPLP